MRIYLAGGASGNLAPFFNRLSDNIAIGRKDAVRDAMKIYLAGTNGREDMCADAMKIYLAKELCRTVDNKCNIDALILETFYYARKNEKQQRLIPLYGDFLLDSGAFSFMSGTHSGTVNWEGYVEEYADFIRRFKVKKYFELDIDSITGYEYVRYLRSKLEKLVGYPPIPVWHKGRGKAEFLRMCDEYKYVAIGGIVTKEISRTEYKFFPWFISEAHKRGAKIHGLGFTNLEGIKKYHFDSVDSTAWTTGNRFGHIYRFDGRTMQKFQAPAGMRVAHKETAINNFIEWIKFQKYAETHL